MLNEQPPERRAHPLESDPPARAIPPADPNAPKRTPVTLHIPTVRPTITLIVIAINVILFLIRAVSPTLDSDIFVWGANNHNQVFINGELYRLFTSMFLHASVHSPSGELALQNSLHLILNCYVIYVTGTQIESLFGHLRFKIIYLLGGVLGSILSALLSPPQVFSVGASGAAFALLGAEFVYYYKHRRLFGERGRAQMRGLIWLAVVNLAFGVASSISTSGARIDNWGHIGGAVGGIVLAWYIAPDFIPRRHPELNNALTVDDMNPLRSRVWAISLYGAALIALLIVGSLVF